MLNDIISKIKLVERIERENQDLIIIYLSPGVDNLKMSKTSKICKTQKLFI